MGRTSSAFMIRQRYLGITDECRHSSCSLAVWTWFGIDLTLASTSRADVFTGLICARLHLIARLLCLLVCLHWSLHKGGWPGGYAGAHEGLTPSHSP